MQLNCYGENHCRLESAGKTQPNIVRLTDRHVLFNISLQLTLNVANA